MLDQTISVPFTKSDLAFFDLETTGLNPDTHEIIEIGMVRINQETLEETGRFEARIMPKNLAIADPVALKINGFTPTKWTDAISLDDALQGFAQATEGSVLIAHNISFDWGFLRRAYETSGIALNTDYHRLDLLSIAYAKLKPKGVTSYRLQKLREYFAIPPNEAHRALADTEMAVAIFKKLMELP